jgi:hypothetical protein
MQNKNMVSHFDKIVDYLSPFGCKKWDLEFEIVVSNEAKGEKFISECQKNYYYYVSSSICSRMQCMRHVCETDRDLLGIASLCPILGKWRIGTAYWHRVGLSLFHVCYATEMHATCWCVTVHCCSNEYIPRLEQYIKHVQNGYVLIWNKWKRIESQKSTCFWYKWLRVLSLVLL